MGWHMRWIPASLVASRFLFGPAVLLLALRPGANVWLLGVLLASMLSDIFDGVIARRLNVATEALRVADSWADAWFFGCVGLAVLLVYPAVIAEFRIPIAIEVVLQGSAYVYDLVRYGRIASLHAYSAKIWGFSLYLGAIGLLVFGSTSLLWVAFACGIVSFLDALAIKSILPGWRHDVLSVFHARKMNPTCPG